MLLIEAAAANAVTSSPTAASASVTMTKHSTYSVQNPPPTARCSPTPPPAHLHDELALGTHQPLDFAQAPRIAIVTRAFMPPEVELLEPPTKATMTSSSGANDGHRLKSSLVNQSW